MCVFVLMQMMHDCVNGEVCRAVFIGAQNCVNMRVKLKEEA